jgi:hypothetical protein
MMTVSERMAALRANLETRILPAVGRDSRSELRAIIKLIDNVAGEIERGPLAMQAELVELLALCNAVAAALHAELGGPDWRAEFDTLKADASSPVSTLTELAALYQRASQVIGGLAVALGAQVRVPDAVAAAADKAMLQRCYETLRRHAAARAPWQSIFAEDGLFAGETISHPSAGASA